MREIRFGVAGLKDSADLGGSVDWLVKGGFAACEVQFVKEFTLKEVQAAKLGKMAADNGIALSVHAPYFAQLTTAEADRRKLHLGALHHSCKLARAMGARVVVCHPGSRGKASGEELLERVDEALTIAEGKIADTGVKLGLETCGRKSQFGSLGDIALLVKNHSFATIVVDYAHIHALSNGSLTSPAALEAVFGFVTEHFSLEHLWPLHTHFADNEFGPAGEIRHVPYGQGSVRIGNVIAGAAGFDFALTVISEHKEASSHEAVLKELRESKAPLIAPKLADVPRPWLPSRIPLEKRGEAHWFRAGPRVLRITNINKLYFPDDGLTKGDLLDYYFNAGPMMLPFLKDRPVNMHRVPEGIYGEAFYEKQAPKGAPDWLKTVPVSSRGGAKKVDFVVVDDVSTLLWMAQMASVECHAWTSRMPALDEPDFAVMDLDPHEPIEFDDVRAVARLVGVLLDKVGVVGFPKTSGGSGIQIFIPLAPGHSYGEVRAFCSAVGDLLRSAYPEKVTLDFAKPKRAGKVYVDVDQNAKGQTLVAPYSVRPYPGAPVSTPLSWEELDAEFYPEQFTMTTLFERIAKVGDLFRPAMSSPQDIRPALAQLTAQ